jgi:hypothetical protein
MREQCLNLWIGREGPDVKGVYLPGDRVDGTGPASLIDAIVREGARGRDQAPSGSRPWPAAGKMAAKAA